MEEIYTVDENGYIVAEEESQVETESEGAALEGALPEETFENDHLADALWSSFFESDLAEPSSVIVPYTADSASDPVSADGAAVTADAVYDLDGMVVFDLYVSSYGACKVVFTPEQAELVTVEAGQLINWSSSNISVPLYRGDPADRPAASTLTLTLLGRGASGFASNLYRYGSAQYVTSYYVNGSSLSSTTTYVAISQVDQVTYSRSYWIGVVIVVCLLLMAVNGLIRFLRRGHRG